MKDRRRVDELSIEELEQVLAIRKREARQQQLREYRRKGRALPGQPAAAALRGAAVYADDDDVDRRRRRNNPLGAVLLAVEVVAVIGLLYLGWLAFSTVRDINAESDAAFAESAAARPTAAATPVITAVVLPSGHTPPDESGFSEFNEAEIPEHLRPLVQASVPAVAIPTPSPEQAQRIIIPAIGVDHPIVQGDGWAQLKDGVGQHIGTANPGQSGNMVLSAHNDIFGEIFRHLDQLGAGDEFTVVTATSEYTYRITGWQVVEPTDTHVMTPTSAPTATLISCYPYLVDSHRIVVFAELVS